MSKDTTVERAALQRAAGLVRPALADKAYVPALTHIRFDGEWATAFDDKMAIAVRCDAPIKRLVPGVLLIQGLTSFGGKDILFQQGEDDSIILKSGRSKVKLPTLATEVFPFKWPHGKDDPRVDIEPDMLKAIARCLISVNNDAAHPAQMGVTLDADPKDRAVFYSTDNETVSRAQCKTKVRLPGGAPVILPRFFCEQLVALSKAFPDCPATMLLGDGYLEVLFEGKDVGGLEARLFSRVPVDIDPMDFPRIVQKHCGDVAGLKARTFPIPDEFDSALDRALLVLGGEVKKKARVDVDGGTLKLHATSDMGDSDDSMKFEGPDVGPVTLDAALVARGLKWSAERVAVTDVVTILTSGEDCGFVHIVAHIREPKKD